jgi:hypothetical protein
MNKFDGYRGKFRYLVSEIMEHANAGISPFEISQMFRERGRDDPGGTRISYIIAKERRRPPHLRSAKRFDDGTSYED